MNTLNTTASIESNASNGAIARGQSMRADLARLGETLGEFKPYDSSNVPAEVSGTRLVKCLYRSDNKEGLASSYTRVPTAHLNTDLIKAALDESGSSLLEHVQYWLESVEDKQIKAAHAKGQLNVFVSGLSIERLVAYLEETTEGGRLNGDKINTWFDSNFEAPLSEIVAAKLGFSLLDATEAQLLKVASVLKAYKAKFAQFASPKASINDVDIEAMRKAIALCNLQDDALAIRFNARMDKMQADSKDALLAL